MTRTPIKVLIVDDSAVIRRRLRDAFARHGFDVVGEAEDPFVAHEAIFATSPDVITLDVEMPKMDGLTFLGKLMQHHPLPVVVHSSVTPENSPQAISALALGAVDAVPKPKGTGDRDAVMARLIKSVEVAAGARPRASEFPADTGHAGDEPAGAPSVGGSTACATITAADDTPIRAVGLAASTGGTQAIESVMLQLPATIPCVLIVQHLPAAFVGSFAARLDQRCAPTIRLAAGGEPLEPGTVLIAPGDRHLTLTCVGDSVRTRLTDGPRVNFHRPSADVLFRGLARHCGPTAIGVVLTGMGSDGAAGLLELREAGAHTMAQSKRTSAVYGMPRAAAELGAAAEIVDLGEVPRRLELALAAPDRLVTN